LRSKIRFKHYSIRTEDAYVDWVRRFFAFHGTRRPADLGPKEVEAFLTHLAVEGKVTASTQNQAKSAILFFYRHVLEVELPWLDAIESAKQSHRLPVVLTQDEAQALLQRMSGVTGLVAKLLYGSGLRLMEAVRLRVKDLDLKRLEILIRDGKGGKDRVTMLPEKLKHPLIAQLAVAQALHRRDLSEGLGEVYLPFALSRKYPSAAREWIWQYVFPADRVSQDPRSEMRRRHHLDEQLVERAVREALRAAGIHKPATPHTLRHYLPYLTMSGTFVVA
jgi:integron integrase